MVNVKSLQKLDGAPHANAFPSEEPKTIRLTLSEGEHVEPHAHPDREIVLYLISGALELQLDGEPYHVDQGDVVHFDGAQEISPVAKTDCTGLLVLAAKREAPNGKDLDNE
ncbi:Cupin domain-containing protein [Halogranum amylolyticum]|uniref:Cupin domain-containing protein n=1 Tax=Halogranum amylolyticum TaxID=660520 RepID=A0A1H8V755_9EURY|nr:cupin domain-containing protein [Halogranum amylolyticum]SEP11209.1 Cupin domain-containing protein [Halogranum amylolyticum]